MGPREIDQDSEYPRTLQRFEVSAVLGTGGMGAVFRARDPQLERDVAIKLLAQATASASELSTARTLDLRTEAPLSPESLLSEARIMAKLSHPNVLPIYEVGLADGFVFLVMEYIDGCDLASWLGEPRDRSQILNVFAQAGRGLAAAHAMGIVHRDFKPNNVLIGKDGRVRVADFGLSRLTVLPTTTMRRVEKGGGTPRYMAPELWQGEPATMKSDVYAYSLALAEALGGDRDALERTLRERGVSPELRAAITSGLAVEPAARPSLETIVRAVDGRSPSPRRWVIGGGIAVLGAGAIFAVMFARSDGPSCEVTPDLVTSWTDARRATLRAAAVDQIVTTIDEGKRAIEAQWRETCEAARDDKRTNAQAAAARSCLERRAFELEHEIERIPADAKSRLVEHLANVRISHVADCATTTAPVIRDRVAVATLYRRIAGVRALPEASRLAAYEGLLADAQKLGEREIEARVLLALASRHSANAELATAAGKLVHAYRIALEIQAPDLQVLTLAHRIQSSQQRGDSREALSLGKLAGDVVESSEISIATRGKLLSVLAHAAFENGELDRTLKLVDEGLTLMKQDGHRLAKLEISFRFDRVNAMGQMEGAPRVEALAVARENVEWTRATFGEDNDHYVAALNILGGNLLYAGDYKGALERKQEAMAVLVKILPAGHAHIDRYRIELARALKEVGRFEEARVELVKVMNAMESSEVLKVSRPLITARLGAITCDVGRCEEGVPLLERAIELGAAQYGTEHLYTQRYRLDLLHYLLELERYDDAERMIAAIDRNFRASKDAHARRLASLHGIASADLAISRGDPKKAEELTRQALAVFTGDNINDELERMELLVHLGFALVAQKRWTAARTALGDAIAIARSKNEFKELIATAEIKLAHVEAALGESSAAVERATQAREVLAAFPIALRARKEADRFLAKHKGKH